MEKGRAKLIVFQYGVSSIMDMFLHNVLINEDIHTSL